MSAMNVADASRSCAATMVWLSCTGMIPVCRSPGRLTAHDHWSPSRATEAEAVDHPPAGGDGPGVEGVTPHRYVHEVQDRLGHDGEGTAAGQGELAAAAADDVDHALLRGRPFVVMVVAGERQVDAALGHDGLNGPPQSQTRPVAAR